jgi:hypothetical protein
VITDDRAVINIARASQPSRCSRRSELVGRVESWSAPRSKRLTRPRTLE